MVNKLRLLQYGSLMGEFLLNHRGERQEAVSVTLLSLCDFHNEI